MIEKCFDEGTIQAFLDGELDLNLTNEVSRHIALCDSCALAVAEAEGEIELAFSALDTEFNTLVPTERLWAKINDSIEAETKSKSIWQSVFAFLFNPSTFALASLLVIFGLFIGLYSLKNGSDSAVKEVAVNSEKTETIINQNNSLNIVVNDPSVFAKEDEAIIASLPARLDKPKFEAKFNLKSKNADLKIKRKVHRSLEDSSEMNSPEILFPSENLAAEESYVKTIATLEKTVNSRKDEVLRPSARFTFERDMAVADDTIKKMKEEVRNDPKNEAARVLLRNTYQNKINLLNSVAEKSELMASLN